MKKLRALLFTFIAVLGLPAVTQAQVDPFMPLLPSTLGRGGSYTANGQGFEAFFYNPAGFARKGEFTLLSTSAYVVMDSQLFDSLRLMLVSGSSSLARSADFGARADTPTLPPEFNDLITAFADIGSYLGAAYTDNNAAFTTLVQTTLQGSSLLAPGVDLSTISSAQDVFAVLDLSKIVSDTGGVASLLNTIISAIDAAPGTYASANAQTAPSTAALKSALDDALAAAATSLPKGNLDVGVMLGAGWAGNGLGLGVFVQGFGIVRTPDMVGTRPGTLLDAKGRAFTSVTLEGGFGFNLTDDISIGVGARPTILGFGDISTSGMLALMSSASAADPMAIIDILIPAGYYKSIYVGLDAGILWDMGDITLGAAVKDILPWRLRYFSFPTSASFVQSLPFQFGTKALSEADSAALYSIPPLKVNLGVQWHPDFGDAAVFLDPQIGVDLFDVFGFVRHIANIYNPDPSLLGESFNIIELFGVGANVKILRFLDVQAGLFKGAVTLGTGFDFGIGELNVAWMARNFALQGPKGYPAFTETGLSFEFAIRW